MGLRSDMIRMFFKTLYLLNSRMGCCITVNHFTTLLLLSVWDLIAMQNIPMPTKGLWLKLRTSRSSICIMQRKSLITPSKDEFLFFLYYTSAGLSQIRFSNFRSANQAGKKYQPFLWGARRLNNRYYVLRLKNMWCSVQQSTQICIVGLIVLMCLSGLSSRLIRCILYLLNQFLNQHIWVGRMLHQAASIAYGL